MNPIKGSLHYPQVTLSVVFLAVAVGIYSLLTMPRREDPKITIRSGLVVAFYPGANSAQVEDQVTRKIEQYLFGYAEVRKEKTYSTTRDGAVVINVELEESVKNPDIFWSKLRHDLNQAKVLDLPQGVQGPIVNTDFGDTVALLIGIESDDLSYTELDQNLKQIEDGLRTIKAVSKIRRYGEQKEQITITARSAQMVQYGIKWTQVVQVLQAQNAIKATGNVKTEDSQVPLYAQGYYNTEQEISNQVIGTSSTGAVVRLGDVATIKREYTEPTSSITVNSHRALMLSVEMQEGNNIVQFGDNVAAKLAEIQHNLPSSIKLTTVVNQPQIVQHSVSDFIREFFLAIISVVIVTIILLPFRIAAVAAMAIPVTVAVTFALLHTFNIELHQVSLAALIVVLGMVVDDAIVIADNYVELLDEGVDRWTAAWRSASDLVVPVLTATATIIASFLPMVILSGSVGEFIFSLPITVSIALASSFIVAMLLTPFLCYTFIKKGLHQVIDATQQHARPKKKSLLDYMQDGYDKAISWCVDHRTATLVFAVVSIAASGLLFKAIRQKFFPAAERNQFVVEVWMPTGTKLEKTKEAVVKLENLIKNDSRVTNYASFFGTSAPRFYYNFSPEPPVTYYGQMLINTHTTEETETLAEELTDKVAAVVPEGTPRVRLMQQGSLTIAPVEVRIVGNDLNELKRLGAQVQAIVRRAPGSSLVRTDFKEDYYGVGINLKDEANRLGFTTTGVATSIYTGFSGAPISVLYEGDQPINLVLRLDEESRRNFSDLENTYLSSPVTGSSVPLRQIATLQPEWQTGRIMHRNGVRTLTVQCEPSGNVLPSEILKAIQPQIAKLDLPVGYSIQYGGEDENRRATFSQMVGALGISLVLIFLILLFQFRNLKESLVVMASIPLSLFGALLGLVLTGNPFGFTAFMGLISLSGIVVRNAIILVDYANELMRKGMDVRTAAIEAGKRRLRPIFLTTMAAAIGVVPMILSGSPMWSPLASVLAVGVIFSMVMALLVIPVLFVMTVKKEKTVTVATT
ncbi:efflux RND transporter permease subunit [Spirosoma oryzicola]|uniref:efflux RND transporter permease subunit n=1 Tax=Spirosoma oryzicola TaxID=2898794 RepID=UPI001E460CAC|nr:efflux RND transporter permease subunit [Spirosoma oryzicola]UHG89260.1 efflux RND transporter permease subunit [Spirosoma oryzicola]